MVVVNISGRTAAARTVVTTALCLLLSGCNNPGATTSTTTESADASSGAPTSSQGGSSAGPGTAQHRAESSSFSPQALTAAGAADGLGGEGGDGGPRAIVAPFGISTGCGVPSLNELELLVDPAREAPAIDADTFPLDPAAYQSVEQGEVAGFWASSTDPTNSTGPPGTTLAWVTFNDGRNYGSVPTSLHYGKPLMGSLIASSDPDRQSVAYVRNSDGRPSREARAA